MSIHWPMKLRLIRQRGILRFPMVRVTSLLAVFALEAEVESYVELESAQGVAGLEVVTAVVVGVVDPGEPGEVLGVVVDQGRTGDEVEVEPVVALVTRFVRRVDA